MVVARWQRRAARQQSAVQVSCAAGLPGFTVADGGLHGQQCAVVMAADMVRGGRGVAEQLPGFIELGEFLTQAREETGLSRRQLDSSTPP